MAEGWVDCPALGPGWKRREAFRKSGATCGRTDTYYQSPTGEKFRSKIELSRFLGPGRDLGNFDFKHGLERPGGGKARKGPKWRLSGGSPPPPPPVPPQLEEVGGPEEAEPQEVEPDVAPPPPPPPPPTPPLAPPPPTEAPPPPEPPLARRTRKRPPPEPPQDTVVACCAGCQSVFPGVTLPPQRRCRWLCPECRARRRDFNREQRFFKRVGCGACQACRIPEDCGICSACARRARAPARAPKCLLRRCLRIVKKGLGCGACQGCAATEDCGSCCICLRRLQPGLKRQWRCLRRRCLRPKSSVAAKKPPCGPRALAAKWKPPADREPSAAPGSRHRKQLTQGKEKKKPGRPPKHPGARGGARGARRRGSRRCGACPACLRAADCGRCDFCRDKPRFGGRNRKRQKCRWRQCLRQAMDKELPGGAEESPGPPPGPPALLQAPPVAPPKEEPAPAPRPRPEDPRGGLSSLGLLIASAPRLKQEQPQASSEPPLAPDPRAGLSDLGLLIASAPRLKQEQPQPSASLVPVPPRLPPAELVVLDESEEEEEEEPSPVPLPLPPPSPPPRWPGAFLAELAEIPLPAHWGLMGRPPPPPPASPPPPHPHPHPHPPPSGLRLVQRCPRSPMAAAVVLLGPGLAFRVLVARRRPVPPGHEVLARRPPRLRGVDDLVELLCDLEAYGACPGPPGRAPGPRCHVLAPAGRCCPPCLLEGGQA